MIYYSSKGTTNTFINEDCFVIGFVVYGSHLLVVMLVMGRGRFHHEALFFLCMVVVHPEPETLVGISDDFSLHHAGLRSIGRLYPDPK